MFLSPSEPCHYWQGESKSAQIRVSIELGSSTFGLMRKRISCRDVKLCKMCHIIWLQRDGAQSQRSVKMHCHHFMRRNFFACWRCAFFWVKYFETFGGTQRGQPLVDQTVHFGRRSKHTPRSFSNIFSLYIRETQFDTRLAMNCTPSVLRLECNSTCQDYFCASLHKLSIFS